MWRVPPRWGLGDDLAAAVVAGWGRGLGPVDGGVALRWIRSTLEPKSTYYYRVVAVDRYNNTGEPGELVKVTTLNTEQKNLPPIKVEGMQAIIVSPITEHNIVNILFRTSCESDVIKYEIHQALHEVLGPYF